MTPTELKEARLSLGLNIKQFAQKLNTPYRTVQDWLGGKNKIPGIVEVAIRGIQREKKMKTDSFHPSNYGSFANNFELDSEGFVIYHVSPKYAKMTRQELEDLRDSSRSWKVRNACSAEINGRDLAKWQNK